MNDEELTQKHLDAQNELNRFKFMMEMIHLVCVGMFLFGLAGLFILKVMS